MWVNANARVERTFGRPTAGENPAPCVTILEEAAISGPLNRANRPMSPVLGCFHPHPPSWGRLNSDKMKPADETTDESQRAPQLAAGSLAGFVVIWRQSQPAAMVLPLSRGQLVLG